MHFGGKLLGVVGLASVALAAAPTAGAQSNLPAGVDRGSAGSSPALCGRGDQREPGLQGEVPTGQTPSYNCGIRLIGELPISGNVQGAGTCVYVRVRNPNTSSQIVTPITVVDVRNPRRPVVVGEPLTIRNPTETFRTFVNRERAILVSGSTIYDIRDCLHPRLLGDVNLPDTALPGVARKNFPHDLRINRTGTRIFYSFGVWEADITNLADPHSWRLTDHRCEVAAQIEGPWQALHAAAIRAGHSLCDDATAPAPRGSNYLLGTSPFVASMIWPQVSHSPDFNADDTRLYVGDQAGGNSHTWAPNAVVRIFDLTTTPYRLIGQVDGGGHGLDWFRVGGREYVLHSNEYGQIAFAQSPPDSCRPLPRPTSVGWAMDGFVSDVTDPTQARNVGMLSLAINAPINCERNKAENANASIAYHLIDDPMDAHFAAVSFGTAGLRFFDIRDPAHPVEVAYFNHGVPVHAGVGYYDPARRLIYFCDAGGFRVLQFEPQVRARLRL